MILNVIGVLKQTLISKPDDVVNISLGNKGIAKIEDVGAFRRLRKIDLSSNEIEDYEVNKSNCFY